VKGSRPFLLAEIEAIIGKLGQEAIIGKLGQAVANWDRRRINPRGYHRREGLTRPSPGSRVQPIVRAGGAHIGAKSKLRTIGF
jgi:hypothetical protein